MIFMRLLAFEARRDCVEAAGLRLGHTFRDPGYWPCEKHTIENWDS